MTISVAATHESDLLQPYQPDIHAIVTGSDGHWRGSVARLCDIRKLAGGGTSDDSALFLEGVAGADAQDGTGGKKMLGGLFNVANNSAREAFPYPPDVGVSTAVMAMHTGTGIAYGLAGDGGVAVISKDGEVTILTRDQVDENGDLNNGIGRKATRNVSEDIHFLPYEKISGIAEIVITYTDGVFQGLDKKSKSDPTVQTRHLTELVRRVIDSGIVVDNPQFASALAMHTAWYAQEQSIENEDGKARTDDIAITAMPARKPASPENYSLCAVFDEAGSLSNEGKKACQAGSEGLKDHIIKLGKIPVLERGAKQVTLREPSVAHYPFARLDNLSPVNYVAPQSSAPPAQPQLNLEEAIEILDKTAINGWHEDRSNTGLATRVGTRQEAETIERALKAFGLGNTWLDEKAGTVNVRRDKAEVQTWQKFINLVQPQHATLQAPTPASAAAQETVMDKFLKKAINAGMLTTQLKTMITSGYKHDREAGLIIITTPVSNEHDLRRLIGLLVDIGLDPSWRSSADGHRICLKSTSEAIEFCGAIESKGKNWQSQARQPGNNDRNTGRY